ncbi:bacillibactin ABC transporter ATPase protein [Natranaerovirga hydrolytica]|uniref:Bacillibactin ABC transporter ATPase protein n=1 Tax=Natranaerovirga hydrolytica TaxID=680378 RepID=A0A4R1MN38_9FIRM|nr:ABC transporter ATP-binding protein [Natranaerovirga hydrolytica]TCK93332.1 bacillibactin ABC transporter ATPase protein [Natranaerovirga hydrolytica]
MSRILRTEKLETCYDHYTVFRDINFAVDKGKITTIIGPNGCGKSTLLKTIGRIIKNKSGAIYLKDRNINNIKTKKIAKDLALLPQNPIAPLELRVEELISYGRFPHCKKFSKLSKEDHDIIDWAMDITKVIDFRDRELGSLSGGQRQKVWLAMALAQDTEILLLDEPTTYLDMAHQLEVLKIVEELNKEKKRTIVMVLHDINHAARFSHKIVAMKSGRIIAEGDPNQVINQRVLKKVFNIDARVMVDEVIHAPVCFGYDTLSQIIDESTNL